MVHRREVDGESIVLGNHGALWGNAMTLWDHETGSVWSQPIGEAILGPLKGTKLELLPSTLTEWGDWQATYPDTFALDAPSTPSGFDLDTMAIVVELGQESVAFPVRSVREVEIANSEVNGAPLAVWVDPAGDNWTVLSRQIDDRIVDLMIRNGLLVEVGGDGRWDPPTGLGVEGTEQHLSILPGFTSFPNDYITFFDDGSFWTSAGLEPVVGP